MKTLVLENDNNKLDSRTVTYMRKNSDLFQNIEVWMGFNKSMWKENQDETIKRFSELNTGDCIVFHTVFDGFAQLELFALLLNNSALPSGLNIHIVVNELQKNLEEYLKRTHSEITPRTREYEEESDKADALCLQFKEDMNFLVRTATKRHNIFQVSAWGEDKTFKIEL